MADLENVKIVDEEKQQPLLQGSAPEQPKSGAGRRTVSNSDKFTRVVLVLLLILNFVQWRYSMINHDASTPDEKESAALKLQDQVRRLCLDRIALQKSVMTANELASFPSDPGHEALDALDDFLSTTTTESEAFTEAFKKVQKVLAQQNELLHETALAQREVSHPHPHQELYSVCDTLAV